MDNYISAMRAAADDRLAALPPVALDGPAEPLQAVRRALPDGNPKVLLGIALSAWSQAQRQALCWLLIGKAHEINDFVPGVWNRLAKARAAIRELEKAGHLTRDAGRLLILESSFAKIPVEQAAQSKQLGFPEDPGLGTALADGARLTPPEAGPVLDRTGCPSGDGRSVLSETGQRETLAVPRVYDVSCPGPARSSRSIELRSIDLDDRGGPSRDCEIHRDHAMEILAKDPRLLGLKGELLRRKTPTAVRWWALYDRNPFRAAQLVSYAATRKNPAASLNTALQRESY